ncbi:MAG: fumarylacetoacetate hydrolase family protein [Alphaproteobacteria bacterium]|jgi:fumarylpyruvate hydrolase|nr:fumarylacetoacetate hydrolase family protein [Alphaproteobacteria bacterium]MDE0812957.1 fumarylacetoacetate hydrolase family protein [Alphaproteobacteria bacterium]|tara:strand:+ start:393 stop:1082 length:690 start_codon:yes stop_codon:yes gene_type:complete
MTEFAIPSWDTPTIPVTDAGKPFPVRRIYCVGRNYAAHAREMGHDPDREPPFFFTKPADAIVLNGVDTPYPVQTSNLHPEIEMVVALATGGTDISLDKANDCIFGYGVGLDLTRRDMQGVAKDMGRPWDMSKGFDYSAPVTNITPVSQCGIIEAGRISLTVNGKPRQESDLNAMIWSVPETINYLSGLIELKPGDLIFTGTPDGVAAIERGDVLEGHVDGLETLKIKMV